MKNRNTMDFLAPSKTSILLFANFPGNLSVNRMFGSPASSATPEGYFLSGEDSSSGMVLSYMKNVDKVWRESEDFLINS